MEVITKDMTVEEALKKLKTISGSKNRFNAERYCGTVKFDLDAPEIQKKLRSEW